MTVLYTVDLNFYYPGFTNVYYSHPNLDYQPSSLSDCIITGLWYACMLGTYAMVTEFVAKNQTNKTDI